MTNRQGLFNSISLIVILILTYSSQVLHSQPINGIPLEAFDGFKKDSFTLPCDSFAQPVYKYGKYQSNITTILDGIGKVYVHHVLHLSNDGYPYIELYSKKPSSVFINGIIRYGNFRMFSTKQVVSDSNYIGNPRIEFVQGLNTIIKTIYPLTIFKISGGNDLKLSTGDSGGIDVSYEVKDFKKYVDRIVYDSLQESEVKPNGNFSGWIQYDLKDNLIQVELCLGASDYILWIFETVIYDTTGTLIGHINGHGPLRFVNLTENHRFAYVNTGGGVNEDYWAPYVFRIFDLKTGEIIFSKRSTTNEVWGFAIPNSNLGVYLVKEQFGGTYSELESYVIDHGKNVMYILHLNPLCKPPTQTTFYPTYCECYMADDRKAKLYYDKDFTSIKFN